MKSSLVASVLAGVLIASCPLGAAAQTLQSFGHGRLDAGTPAAPRTRRLVVLMVEFDGAPSPSMTPTQVNHLFFDRGDDTDLTVSGYIREASHRSFAFTSGGVWGPYFVHGASALRLDDPAALAAIISQFVGYLPLGTWDTNQNGRIERNELAISVVANHYAPASSAASPPPNAAGATRDVSVDVPGALPLDNLAVTGFGDATTFETWVHESLHQLGALDVYGEGTRNVLLSIMSTANPGTYYPDPWHRMEFGWIAPAVRDLQTAGVIDLRAAGPGDYGNEAVVLYDAARGTGEYFLVEYRDPGVAGAVYDRDVAGHGVVIWHVQQREGGQPLVWGVPTGWAINARNAYNLAIGDNRVWPRDAATPELTWYDGTPTGFALQFRPAGDATRVAWAPVPRVHRIVNAADGGWIRMPAPTRRPEYALAAPGGQFVRGLADATVDVTGAAPRAEASVALVDLNGAPLEDGDAVQFQTQYGTWLTADGGGGSGVRATAAEPGEWETFTIEKVDPRAARAIHNQDVVRLRSQNGSYVQATGGGGGGLVAAGSRPDANTEFTLWHRTPAFLRALDGSYVSADQGGGGAVTATGAALDAWARFTLADADHDFFAAEDRLQIRSFAGLYLNQPDASSGAPVQANVTLSYGDHYALHLLDGPGRLTDGTHVAFSVLSRRLEFQTQRPYLSATNGGGGDLRLVTRAAPGADEVFTVQWLE